MLIIISCQKTFATESISTTQSTIAVTKIVSESIEPSPTPTICTPTVAGTEINVDPVSADSAIIRLEGLQPNEKLTLLFVAKPTATQSSEREISPFNRVEPDGRFFYQEGSLTKLEQAVENTWTVKVIHSNGVICKEFTLP